MYIFIIFCVMLVTFYCTACKASYHSFESLRRARGGLSHYDACPALSPDTFSGHATGRSKVFSVFVFILDFLLLIELNDVNFKKC